MRLDDIRHEIRLHLDEIDYDSDEVNVIYINRQIRIDVGELRLYYDIELSDIEIIDVTCSKVVGIEVDDVILDEIFG